ncbi:MAG TPA: hypothetical protein VHE12_03245 [bacterium]|nr:hypothetical protein [bacterium]
MTKQKGPKKAKTLFMIKRLDRKKVRHLKGEALSKAMVDLEAKWQKAAALGKR